MGRTRRDFLVWMAAAAAALTAPAWLSGALRPARPRSGSTGSAEGGLARLVGGEGPRALGRAYLRTTPQERDATALVWLLLPDRAERARFSRMSEAERREALRARVREDFRAGRVTQVEGWVLARTEARLCALRALV